jgi:hypothetical protein
VTAPWSRRTDGIPAPAMRSDRPRGGHAEFAGELVDKGPALGGEERSTG